jgi:hypothetical protein
MDMDMDMDDKNDFYSLKEIGSLIESKSPDYLLRLVVIKVPEYLGIVGLVLNKNLNTLLYKVALLYTRTPISLYSNLKKYKEPIVIDGISFQNVKHLYSLESSSMKIKFIKPATGYIRVQIIGYHQYKGLYGDFVGPGGDNMIEIYLEDSKMSMKRMAIELPNIKFIADLPTVFNMKTHGEETILVVPTLNEFVYEDFEDKTNIRTSMTLQSIEEVLGLDQETSSDIIKDYVTDIDEQNQLYKLNYEQEQGVRIQRIDHPISNSIKIVLEYLNIGIEEDIVLINGLTTDILNTLNSHKYFREKIEDRVILRTPDLCELKLFIACSVYYYLNNSPITVVKQLIDNTTNVYIQFNDTKYMIWILHHFNYFSKCFNVNIPDINTISYHFNSYLETLINIGLFSKKEVEATNKFVNFNFSPTLITLKKERIKKRYEPYKLNKYKQLGKTIADKKKLPSNLFLQRYKKNVVNRTLIMVEPLVETREILNRAKEYKHSIILSIIKKELNDTIKHIVYVKRLEMEIKELPIYTEKLIDLQTKLKKELQKTIKNNIVINKLLNEIEIIKIKISSIKKNISGNNSFIIHSNIIKVSNKLKNSINDISKNRLQNELQDLQLEYLKTKEIENKKQKIKESIIDKEDYIFVLQEIDRVTELQKTINNKDYLNIYNKLPKYKIDLLMVYVNKYLSMFNNVSIKDLEKTLTKLNIKNIEVEENYRNKQLYKDMIKFGIVNKEDIDNYFNNIKQIDIQIDKQNDYSIKKKLINEKNKFKDMFDNNYVSKYMDLVSKIIKDYQENKNNESNELYERFLDDDSIKNIKK